MIISEFEATLCFPAEPAMSSRQFRESLSNSSTCEDEQKGKKEATILGKVPLCTYKYRAM